MECRVEMYEKTDGKMPVMDFIQSLEAKKQAKISREIDLLKIFGDELHYPHVDKVEGKKYNDLKELRIKLATNIFRIFFFLPKDNTAILLHGIVKKTQKTPKKELDVALERMKEYLRGNENGME